MARNMPQTLDGLLVEGQRLYSKVSDADFKDEAERDRTIDRGRQVLEALHQGVSREGVFSSNEEIDDVETNVLPLLGTDFYLGSFLLRLPFADPQDRLKILAVAESLLLKYLNTCEQLHVLEEDDRQAWQSHLKDDQSSRLRRGHPMGREQKIERFRRQKKSRQRMQEIEDELLRGEGKDCDDTRDDDGIRRERALLLLSSLASDALDEVSGLHKETEMLQHMLKAKEDAQIKLGYGIDLADRIPEAVDHSNGLEVTHISRVGASLQIRKEDVRGTVFKPTVAPPTMTVEEFGQMELQRARHRQAADEGQKSTHRRYDQLERDGDEDDEELVQQAVYHDRDWDNWKDENPRGSGNKANKRI